MVKLWIEFLFLSIDLWFALPLVLLNVDVCLVFVSQWQIEMRNAILFETASWDEKCLTDVFLMLYLFSIKLISQFWYWNGVFFFVMQILVVFMGSEPVTVKTVRAIHSQVSSTVGLHGLILVLQSKMNHFAKKELATFPCTVETFPVSRSPFCCMMKYSRYKCELPRFGSS